MNSQSRTINATGTVELDGLSADRGTHHANGTPRHQTRLLVMWLCMVASLGAGCSGAGESANWMLNGFLDPSQVGQFRGEKRNEVRSVISILEEPMGIPNTEEPTPEDHQPRFEESRISPGDAINITIFELMAAGQASETQLRIGNSGFETIPGIGRVRLVGFTPRELEMEIKRYLRDQQILADADVQVSQLEVRSQQFTIIGTVQRPGTYALPRPDYRLLQALAEAGGISPLIDKVYVFRRGAADPNEAANKTSAPAGPTDPPGPMVYHLSDTGRNGNGSPTSSSAPASETQPGLTLPVIDLDEPPPTTSRGTMADPAGEDPLPGLASDDPLPAPSEAQDSAPANSRGSVDEMEILEGKPSASQPAITWDPARGGWVIEGVAADQMPGPATAPVPQPGQQPPPAPSDGVWSGDDQERVRILEIPAKELLEGDSRYNIVIRPFDLINIPPGAVGEYYLQGNVARPGAYQMSGRRPTLKEAIAAAGGFGPLAWPSRVDLIRRVSKDEEQIIQVNLDAIYSGVAPDLYLKPNDLVNVGSSPAAVFLAVLRNAFRFTYGFGFVYDRNFADADTFGAREQIKQRRLQENQIRGLPTN